MRSLALLSLALFSFVTPAPAQSLELSSCTLRAQMILPIDYQGRPAFLLLGSSSHFAAYRGDHNFRSVPAKPWTGIPSFRLVAGFFQDLRPCAPGSPVAVCLEDFPGTRLGDIGANGTLTWTGSPGVSIHKSGHMATDLWHANYCYAEFCNGKCMLPGSDGPQFSALVLVLE